jgi:hypothetical protein
LTFEGKEEMLQADIKPEKPVNDKHKTIAAKS